MPSKTLIVSDYLRLGTLPVCLYGTVMLVRSLQFVVILSVPTYLSGAQRQEQPTK